MDPSDDVEASPTFKEPLFVSRAPRTKLSTAAVALTGVLLLVVAALAAGLLHIKTGSGGRLGWDPIRRNREVRKVAFSWTNEMWAWQRTGFHFQPKKNFQSDPNAPMYYKGWYHFFYQYNPKGAFWDYSISWGHAVSHDLIHWLILPLAMQPDHWYDIKGTWTGTATILSDGRIVVLYTGGTEELVQVQNLAVPVDPSDPLLLRWNKSTANPILRPPPGIGDRDFRDPFPVWYNNTDSTWHVLIGSKNAAYYGIVLIYTTKDFLDYTLLPNLLHTTAEKVGMLECVDFYPVATTGPLIHQALDMSVVSGSSNDKVKHVIKASMDDERHDYYAIGTFDLDLFTFTPDDSTIDVGVGLRYDWGKFYASKTFFDPVKQRRVLWGYVGETDTKDDDIQKGWAAIQNIPRTILFDTKTGSNLLFWPVEEVEKLRTTSTSINALTVDIGSTIELDVGDASQLDIEAEFQIEEKALEAVTEADVTYNCSTSGGAANRGMLGPFGLLVLANKKLTEQTATYFYVSKGIDGSLQTHFCQDELRSSKANDIVKRVVGHTVPVLAGESFTLRMLVDHSIVESFAQGGRAVATSRVYPTEVIGNASRVFLFNNATGATVTTKSLKIWHMNSTFTHPYHFPGVQETTSLPIQIIS